MEKSTYTGIILGVVAIITGLLLKGASLSILFNPAAIMIIFVGTAASLLVGFPLSELKKFPTLIKILFKKQELMSKREVIKIFTEFATISRREGLLALENKIEDINDPFLKNGIRMIIDGNDHEFVKDVLLEDISATQERHKLGAKIFSQAGTYAPTLGVLGAVLGLVSALGNMDDIATLGHSIAAAFVATLYGIFTGYVLWHPMCNKLQRLSSNEIELRLMMVEGLLSIQSGVSTLAIEQKLSVFLPPKDRMQEGNEESEGGLAAHETVKTA